MTGLLLDTHIFLWYASSDSKLNPEIRRFIEEEQGQVYLSSVSAWEISIKHGLGKLDLPHPISDLLELSIHGIEVLQPSAVDYIAYSQLDFPSKKHRDPFDRMLIVQAREHNLLLVTSDEAFEAYLSTNLLLVQ